MAQICLSERRAITSTIPIPILILMISHFAVLTLVTQLHSMTQNEDDRVTEIVHHDEERQEKQLSD